MGKRAACFLAFALAVISVPSPAQDEAPGKKGFFSADNWQVDVYGGWTAINPSGLNLFPQYYEKFIQFMYLDFYAYNKQVYGNYYSYTATLDPKNSFQKITRAFPVGAALRYRLNRDLDVSVGLSYLGHRAESFFHATVATNAIPPNAYGTWGLDDIDVRDLTYDGIRVSVRSWIPAVGAHYRVFSRGALKAELSASAGPVFASFEHEYHSYDKYTFPDGFWFGFERQTKYKGHGVGIALSGGGRIGLRLLSRLEVFAAAVYQFIRVPTVTGSAVYDDRYLDAASQPPRFTTAEASGTWTSGSASYVRNWGRLSIATPFLTGAPSQYPDGFDINLSGVSLGLGISFRL